MTITDSRRERPAPPSPRLFLPLAAALSFLTLNTILRVALFSRFGRGEGASGGEIVHVLLTGLVIDVAVVILVLAIPALVVLAVPARLFAWKPMRVLAHAKLLLFFGLLPFTLTIEWYFFDEFDARFNTVAVDYLLFPKEVAGNIRESYPLFTVLTLCALLALAQWWLLRRLANRAWSSTTGWGSRLRDAFVLLGACAVAWASLGPGSSKGHSTRVLDELADDGVHSFARAAITHDLDYRANYLTLSHEEAWRRTAARVGLAPGATTLEREIPGDAARPKLNVVLVLEESLGSEFWGSLGREKATATPEMDRLSAQGVLFTHLHASGNRTVRGMEGVLSSFPPLPGDSIVRRPHSEHVETIARALRRDGYDTVFVYGGRGVFDGMRSFTTANGWDRFVEQKDFASPTHVTIWGVSDEDLFGRCLEEMSRLRDAKRPWLLTALTVSNHKPYTFPDGRITPPPEFHRREKAVMYADWAVARFLQQARDQGFWKDTIFAVVADHGARVYGSQDIPMKSYEIPLVMFGPEGVVPQGLRCEVPGNSIDVSPTILGRIGRPRRTVFFGRDLLAEGAADRPALIPMHHDRDIGLLGPDAVAVLGLHQSSEAYALDASGLQAPHPMSDPTPSAKELIDDAAAIYQVADEVYLGGRYRVTGDPQ